MSHVPMVPISQERLQKLIGAMLVYQQFRQHKTPPSEERAYTLWVLMLLIPKLLDGVKPHEGDRPLLLLVDEVQVMKGGLATIIDQLKRKPASPSITREITHLTELKTMLDQHFSTTQD